MGEEEKNWQVGTASVDESTRGVLVWVDSTGGRACIVWVFCCFSIGRGVADLTLASAVPKVS